MIAERRAALLSLLDWLRKLAPGNVVVRWWTEDCLRELAALESGEERAA